MLVGHWCMPKISVRLIHSFPKATKWRRSAKRLKPAGGKPKDSAILLSLPPRQGGEGIVQHTMPLIRPPPSTRQCCFWKKLSPRGEIASFRLTFLFVAIELLTYIHSAIVLMKKAARYVEAMCLSLLSGKTLVPLSLRQMKCLDPNVLLYCNAASRFKPASTLVFKIHYTCEEEDGGRDEWS